MIVKPTTEASVKDLASVEDIDWCICGCDGIREIHVETAISEHARRTAQSKKEEEE